ncbi:Ig-like domain-containing protein [Geofilum sp. OHC36d9]|uniref:Ig-like domain-containing protein n=1 Tax=Geofilum sp. OHC36d9 TaxID=3458413 RepID=UPI004033702D
MKNFYLSKLVPYIFVFSALFFSTNYLSAQCDDISISGLDTEYCIIDQATQLTGLPYGGTFSGPGITDDLFDPSTAGAGTHEIKYVFDNIYYKIDQTGDFNPITSPGNDVVLSDDKVSPALSLEFTFNFFGVDYTEFYICSNGFITFDSGSDDDYNAQDIPNPKSPNNLIAFAWTDLNPDAGGTITYVTLGTAPNRVCVINISDVPYYDDENTVTTQIKLFETTNVIEIHSTDISSSDDEKTMGVENEDGTLGYAIDGRNKAYWSASNDFVKFTPVYCKDSITQVVTVNDDPAELNLLTGEISFGEVFINGTISKDIRISNTGCDTLHVDSVKNAQSDISFDKSAFDIMPGDTGTISVTFTPTALQTYTDAIQIYTNDTDVSVNLSGEGIASPTISLDTDTLKGSINDCSGTLDFTFNIQNSGENDLEYTISSAVFEDDFEDGDISDWTIDSEVSVSVVTSNAGDGTYSAIMSGGSDWSTYHGMMQSFTSSQPEYISVMVYPDTEGDDNAIFFVGDENASDNGGIINFVYKDAADSHFDICDGLYFYTDESRWYQFEFKNIDFDNATFDCYIDGELFQKEIPFFNNSDYVSDVYLTDYTDSNIYWDNIFIGNQNEGLEFNPTSGTLTPGSSQEISVSFDSDGLNSGLLENTLFIKSNDPVNETNTVICVINKDGDPEIASSVSSYDFGDVIVNDSASFDLMLYNSGCDTLFVDSVKTTLAEFMVEDSISLQIMPNDSSMISVCFKPTSLTDFSDHLVIYHTDETELNISLTGSGLDAPEMTVNPDTVEVSMGCDGIASTSFTINNAGAGTLEYNVKNTFVDLELISGNLDANYTSILDVIPNRSDFYYDGDEYNINDGNDDMYDQGNYLSTDIGGDIKYSDDIMESSYLGEKGRYFTREYDGLFVFAGNLDNISDFEVNGDLGADGNGSVDGKKLTLVHNGTTYYGFVKRVYATEDPSVNHLFITENPNVEQDFRTNTDDDYHKVSNLEDVNVLYYLLYASQNGGYVSDSETLNIMAAFLDAIDVDSDESITITPSTGTISSGGSQVVDVDLTFEQINTGTSYTNIVVSSNDPLNSLDTVVVKLTIDGQAEISLPTECIDFSKVAVTDSLKRVVTISNIGCDTLLVNDIDASLSQYLVTDTVYKISPYDSAMVSVYLKPDVNSTFDANLTLQTNIGDYQVCLTGEGVASFADIAVDSTSFNATLECTASAEAPIEIFNNGEADLNYSISADEPFVEFSEESGLIANNASASISVKIVGSELPAGTYNANITISSNDPDTKDLIIPVTLNNISGGYSSVTIDASDSDICQGETLSLNAGYGFADYNWSTSESTRTITASETNKYKVIATDYYGCVSMDSVNITVHNPTIALAPTASICIGDEITFDAGDDFSTYEWNDASTEQTLTVDAAGIYSVSVTDEFACPANASVVLTVNSLPVVDLPTTEEICDGDEITFDAGEGFNAYAWSNSSTEQTIAVSEAGTYTVTVTDENACSNSASVELTVNSLPIVDLPITEEICDGDEITFDAGDGFSAYAWNNNPSAEQTVTVSEAGTYTVTVTDENACSNSASVELTVNSLPIVDLPTTEEICDGDEITFDAGEGFSAYAWSNNSSAEQTVTVSEAGTYTVTVTDENACSNSASVELTANSLPVVDLGDDVTITTAESVTLDAGEGFATYVWNDASIDQTLVVNGASIEAGEYEYSVLVTDANSCSNSDTIMVTTNAATGINSPALNDLVNIYPVPTRDYINLNFLKAKDNLTIELINVTGSLIYKNKLGNIHANENFQIDVRNNSTGMYYLKIYSDNFSVTKKVMIQK